MIAFYYDLAMLVVWPLVAVYNRQAFLMYFLLVYYTFLFQVTNNNFQLFTYAATGYFLASILEIKLLSHFRKALLLHGLLYYFLAIDDVLYNYFNYASYLYYCKFWFIVYIDLLIIIILTGGSNGRKVVKSYRILDNCRSFILSLQKACKNHHRAGKRP